MDNTIQNLFENRITREKRTPELELAQYFKSIDLPYNPNSFEKYLEWLEDTISPSIVNVSDPQFIGHMTSALPSFHQTIAQKLVAWNQNVVKIETSSAFTFLERQCIAMMHQQFFEKGVSFYQKFIQNNKCILGSIVSNGSAANISALWAARNNRLNNDKIDCQEQGVISALNQHGYSDMVIIASELAHYSLEKFASLTGLGKKNILRVKTTNGQIDIRELHTTIEKCKKKNTFIIALVGIAGTTEMGSIDDLEKMACIANEFNIHFHVDAAWGGPIIFSEKQRHKLKGIEKADSITICGHKQLYLPQGVSLVLYRSPNLCNAIETTSRYQAREGSFDLGRWTFEGSRPAVSLFLHAALHCIGKKGYSDLIEHGIQLAAYFTKKISQHDYFEPLHRPHTNIVCYRYKPRLENQECIDQINVLLQKMSYEQGKSFVSRTTLFSEKYDRSIVVLRAVFTNPKTTYEDIDIILQEQLQYGQQVEKKFSIEMSQS